MTDFLPEGAQSETFTRYLHFVPLGFFLKWGILAASPKCAI